PRGILGKRDGLMLAVAGILALAVAGWSLNPLTLALLPVAVLFLTLYPYTKRFTWLCHYWLGATTGAAAAGGWIAVTGSFSWAALCLMAGVGLWIAGFDIIYGMLDRDFDLQYGVYSIPAAFGLHAAARIAALTHLAAWVFLALAMPMSGSGWPYMLGLVAVGGVLVIEHLLVRSRNVADVLKSFNANLYIGLLMLVAIALDVSLRA
ncbi:MAG TPA: 4-hydroxybenzoate octaprenyltransferase, partial [Trueperaceae bacterium]